MNYNNEEISDSDMWNWQGQDYSFEDNACIDISKCHLSGVEQNEDHFSFTLDDENTPVKACGDLTFHVTDGEATEKELEQCREPFSQAKRRRTLQFEPEVLSAPLYNDDLLLRSKETEDSLEDAISDMSEWVAGFAGTSASSNDCLDPSSEGWIADYFNDAEIQCSTEDISGASGTPDIQINITESCNKPPEYDANPIKNHPVHSRRNVVFKGRKSYMRSPPKLASSVVYPFAFIKPCGAHGDVTLKDINQRLHTPKSKQNEEDDDPSVSYPTSAFSGKPVVGKTKIRTEGGEGSITIMRTKG